MRTLMASLLAMLLIAPVAPVHLAKSHDQLWKNGNVPIVLQRLEYLGNRGPVDAVERLH